MGPNLASRKIRASPHLHRLDFDALIIQPKYLELIPQYPYAQKVMRTAVHHLGLNIL